jgi:PilZ domain
MFTSPRAQVVDNPVNKERRSWDRLPVQIQVFCQNVQGEDELCWSARVKDISRGGIGLLSPHKFEPSTIIRIGKAHGFEESSRLVQATVVRAERSPGEKWTLGCALTRELSEAELLAWTQRGYRD